MTTIKDVARVANVSIATVSATFNNSAVVREETRKRVQDAAAQVGYTPNSIARSLRLARTNLIGA
ncbi:MAG: LacI family DNA-binding transcriptional regulator, partial [Phycisphaerales bacterium]|nr:LacI family DNA-binding transcriptional regulator [Phycisphaerales bacterium]